MEFQLMEFQILKYDAVKVLHSWSLLKVATGLENMENSAVATGLEKVSQFSFQSQRRAMPKNGQTTSQLYSFHMPARSYSKFFKLVFNSM